MPVSRMVRTEDPPSMQMKTRTSPPSRFYANYTYELYGNPTFADLEWKALPFALTQTGAIDRRKHTATRDGSLNIFVEAKALKGFYKVTFRVPGANTGTP